MTFWEIEVLRPFFLFIGGKALKCCLRGQGKLSSLVPSLFAMYGTKFTDFNQNVQIFGFKDTKAKKIFVGEMFSLNLFMVLL